MKILSFQPMPETDVYREWCLILCNDEGVYTKYMHSSGEWTKFEVHLAYDISELDARDVPSETSKSPEQSPPSIDLANRLVSCESLLRELDGVLSLCDQKRRGRIVDPVADPIVNAFRHVGLGALMDACQREWESRDPVGCFTVGPCLGTVRHARKLIAAFLASGSETAGPAGTKTQPTKDDVTGSRASGLPTE